MIHNWGIFQHKKVLIQICFLFALFSLFQCEKESVPVIDLNKQDSIVLTSYLTISYVPDEYSAIPLPTYFNNVFIVNRDNTPDTNVITNWGATMGRVLFYDKKLSANNKIACASCHIQQFGFSDTAILSEGFLGGRTKRHSMGLVNAKYYPNKKFFWDERAASLEEQVLMPIQDQVEMGMPLDSLIKKLNQLPYYKVLCKKAFGDSIVKAHYVSKALSQFVRSMVSYRSKYDQGRVMVNHDTASFPNFTASENLGKRLFFLHDQLPCSVCHGTSVFSIDVARNNGVKSTDKGKMDITGDPMDLGTFKVPSLKNIAVRPPYMHNGSFASLEEVIEHYSNGFYDTRNLDPHMYIGGQTFKYNFTEEEKTAMIDFLKTLTDKELIQDKKFSNPFK